MESRDRPAQALSWPRLVAGCALLVGLAFIQDPGYLISDTKFDLAVAPLDFLARSLHLWDAQGAFGQLQNQAYGYLWPMGPFFAAGVGIGLSGWVVQRLWIGLVMSVAFVGAAKVARALGIRTDLACLLTGVAFALSARMLTTLGPISIEAWPGALLPWVLLPLIHGSRGGSPRRAAALSALAVAMVGGVNAVATFAVIPLGAIWLLTRTPGPRRRALMLWWPVFTFLGTAWWLIPLFVMGAYSPPFLDFIETTSVTTFPTTISDALRGASHWVPYVDAGSRAGNDLITTSFIALDLGMILFLGFLGLADRRTPERAFLALGLAVGLLMVTMGHHGSVEGWFQAALQGSLDGVLAPLRNVHKFDPVLRLPLVLGLGFAVDRALRALRETDRSRWAERLTQGVAVGLGILVVGGAAAPAFAGRLAPASPVVSVPGYWHETADWLAAHQEPGTTALLAPGSPFAEYIWGSPKDEPLQSLASSPWAVRNVIPLAPPGNIRMLDQVESAFAQGRGSAALIGYLRRAGVQYLVVRNDLAPGGDVPHPLLVHQAIAHSPGLARVASFGPQVGADPLTELDGQTLLVSQGWQASYPAIEIFEVSAAAPAVADSSPTPIVVGGPEDLYDLMDLGLLDEQPTVLAVDVEQDEHGNVVGPAAGGPVVLTDGLRQRERFFGRVHDGYSPVLTSGDVRRSGNPTRDYLDPDADAWTTTVRLSGAAAISASSSESDSTASGGADRGRLPYAALDSSEETSWRSGARAGDPAWWQVDLAAERSSPRAVRLTGGPGNPDNLQVAVVTEAGTSDPVTLGDGVSRTVPLPPGPMSSLRVEVVGEDLRQLALADVSLPGLEVRRSLVLPRIPASWPAPDSILLRTDLDRRTGCVETGAEVRCASGQSRTSEEAAGMSRVVTLGRPASYPVAARALPRPGRELDTLTLADQPVDATVSSVLVETDSRDGAVAAIDGDEGTSWLSDPTDGNPTLTLSWLGQRRVSGVEIDVARTANGRRPTALEISWPGGSRLVELRDGAARFAPIRTDRLVVRVVDTAPKASLGFDQQVSDIGVAISEIRLRGVPYLPVGLSQDVRSYRCGSGPDLRIGSRTIRTRLEAAPAALARSVPVSLRLCGASSVDLASGETVISATPSDVAHLESLVLGTAAASSPPARVATESDGPVRRVFDLPPAATLLDARQNANPGWTAEQDGAELAAVTLDGWRQGWSAQPGAGAVVASFAPDRPYRLGLVAGAVGLLALVALVLISRRWHDETAALEPRPLTGLTVAACVVGTAGLAAGWLGVVVTAVAGAAWALAQRRWPDLAPGLFAAPCLIVGVAYSFGTWGGDWAGGSAWPHYLMLLPLFSVFASVPRRPLRLTPLSRSAGRSTTR